MTRKRKPRRGILLLIVLSLLVLFVLIGVTFIVVANQHYDAASASSRYRPTLDRGRELSDSAMLDVLRGTTDPHSPLFRHSLLGDLYGLDGFTGVTVQEIKPRSFDVLEIRFNPAQAIPLDPISYPLRKLADGTAAPGDTNHFAGCVLTMIDGPLAGQSTRVISYLPLEKRMLIHKFDSDLVHMNRNGNALVQAAPIPLTGANRFVVNGRPFSGAGQGFLNLTGQLDQAQTPRFNQVSGLDPQVFSIALLPNWAGYRNLLPNLGGADESWDAVDYQNMHLAMLPPQTTPQSTIIPSFHRPFLVNYWMRMLIDNGMSQLWNDGNPLSGDDEVLRRMFVMRPMPMDHPRFTGSNPFFVYLDELGQPLRDVNGNGISDLIDHELDVDEDGIFDPPTLVTGPWDVDNDGDGIAESVWLDLGFPVQSTADGRLFKPLVAMLCTDMDGRLNVNAHGLPHHSAPLASFAGLQRASAGGSFVSTPDMRRGQGYGPAEINLANLLTKFPLLYARRNSQLANPTDQLPGLPNQEDRLSLIQNLGMPPIRFGRPVINELNEYGSAPDLHGRGKIVLDHNGAPLFDFTTTPVDHRLDDPYEVNLVTPNAQDSTFSAAELEPILRFADVDATNLPDRLLETVIVPNQMWELSRMITTDSFEVPAVPMLPAIAGTTAEENARNTIRSPYGDDDFNNRPPIPSPSLQDWVAHTLRMNGVPQNQIQNQLALMLPTEFLKGQRMDINRAFGNGRDDNTTGQIGFGVVDEPGEVNAGQRPWPANVLETMFAGDARVRSLALTQVSDYTMVGLDGLARLGLAVPTAIQAMQPQVDMARQSFARHLYCLARFITDPGFRIQGMTGPLNRDLTNQRLAQWAVNVVDFRDSDAIMTPFEYDVDPSNGWQVDGNPSTIDASPDRRLVWGCESPELLMTETMAFHDRRVKDTDWDTGDGQFRIDPDADPPAEGDDDLDQYRIPQGSLFLEFFCPHGRTERTIVQKTTPRELYAGTSPGNIRLDLGRMSATRGVGGVPYPVWRVAISTSHAGSAESPHKMSLSALVNPETLWDVVSFNPSDMNLLNSRTSSLPIERIVWFTQQAPADDTWHFDRIYWNRSNRRPLLLPGEYAVVGPRVDTVIGSRIPVDASQPYNPSLQRIVLAPGNVSTYLLDGTIDPNVANRKPALSIIAAANPPAAWTNRDREIGISVSEPIPSRGSYYAEPNPDNDRDREPFDCYDNPRAPMNTLPDTPFDDDPIYGSPLEDEALPLGTTHDYKTAFLQRLANPLLGWNPEPGRDGHQENLPVNPYITVDWSPIDLTIFNGEDREPDGWDPGLFGEFDSGHVQDETFFTTREPVRLWSRTFGEEQPDNAPVDLGGEYYFGFNLRNTLGHIPSGMGIPRSGGDDATLPPEYHGAPTLVGSWLTWNDRPYVSPIELTQVPASSPSRLLHEFGFSPLNVDPYDESGEFLSHSAPFRHLLNFYNSSEFRNGSPNLSRLLDYLEVPSRFVGTKEMVDANTNKFPGYQAPFNTISQFRNPGKVNINTIFDRRVWEAIDPPDSLGNGTLWKDVEDSRRGFSLSQLNNSPTLFGNPFRSAASADVMPLLASSGDKKMLRQTAANATLLREDEPDSGEPLFLGKSVLPYSSALENSYFRYETVQRLSNLLTTQSNVYALWVTVGYFEVHPWNTSNPSDPTNLISNLPPLPDDAHPDGYQLGEEIGSDNGTVKRHRAFYMIDRSRPVAFQPGENHNVDDAVLLKRFIE